MRGLSRYAWPLEVIERDDFAALSALAGRVCERAKGSSILRLVEDTLPPEFDYRYFVLINWGHRCSRAPTR